MTKSNPEHVTQLLQRWKLAGDHDAEQELFAVVEQELTRLAQSTLRGMSGFAHKIEPCELVSQAYLNLRGFPIITENRAPFFKLMASTMRHVLIDLARHDRAEKRPPSRLRIVDAHAADSVPAVADIELFDFYRTLDSLRAVNARQADTIELRIVGLSNKEIAAENHVSIATVKRDVDQGRAFLAFQLGLPSNWLKP
jgi:RNA polymerase sigma factor (TIGR02999 family)